MTPDAMEKSKEFQNYLYKRILNLSLAKEKTTEELLKKTIHVMINELDNVLVKYKQSLEGEIIP